jgi:light-regulated signal transduction histidine kinase (bacteriophytochrome)
MTIAWMTPSLILAGLIFSIRQMLLVSLVHLMVPLFLPVLIPGLTFHDIFVGTGYLLVVSAMILVTLYLREQLENEKQRELARLNEELEARVLERTAQLEAFSYNVSHDLRAPLRAVRGFSEILTAEHSQNLDREGQMYLDRIKTSSQKMDHLIDDILMLSRLGRTELELEDFEISTLAKTIFADLAGAEDHPDRISFTAEECPPVTADKHLLSILLTNLISNSIKFSRRCPSANIYFGCRQNGNHPEFFLQDNGVGFDPQLTEQALRPFQRLHSDEEYEGTGIGLAIVSSILQRHNGEIRLESEPGVGTTVFFSIGSPPPSTTSQKHFT